VIVKLETNDVHCTFYTQIRHPFIIFSRRLLISSQKIINMLSTAVFDRF